jgi:methyltransferase (TIGR00027 family)
MLDAQPSRTLLRPAIMRAAHQLLDRPLIFHDPLAVGLVPECSREAILDAADQLRAPGASLLRSVFVLRSRLVEDRLREALARGARQYLVLGAGLETYPWRQPPDPSGVTIFSLDHPASAAQVRGWLNARGLEAPGNLIHVDCDLETDGLAETLAAAGFRPDLPTFTSMLGLTQYLRRDTVATMLGFLGSLPAPSETVLSFAPPAEALGGDDATEATAAIARSEALGEPWLYRPSPRELGAELERASFRTWRHVTVAEAQKLYFADRKDALRASAIEQLVIAHP